MLKFMERYGPEAQCQEALVAARWPEGFECLRCRGGSSTTFQRHGRQYLQCRSCRHKTTVTSGTVFDSSQLGLRYWFLAIHLMTQAKNNVAALELRRQLGVSYHAVWRLKHKLMAAMEKAESRRELSVRAEIDDAYLGGEKPGKCGRSSENKIPFVIVVGTKGDDDRAYKVALRCLDFTKEAISDWANNALASGVHVVSDALPAFGALGGEVAQHITLVTGSGRAAAQDVEFQAVNILLGNLKTAIAGTYHAFRFKKYAPRYLADFQYRFNRRFDLSKILPGLIRTTAKIQPWPERKLKMAELVC